MMGPVRVGTCGFCLPPPEYFRVFGTVELAERFQRLPLLEDARRWRAEAPDDFAFTLRAPRVIANPPVAAKGRGGRLRPDEADRAAAGGFLDTPIVRRAWRATLDLARALEAPIVVFPSPRSFRPTDENVSSLVRFFEWAHRDRLCLAWGPCGDAWTDDLVRTLCRELSLAHVVDPFERRCVRPRPPYFHPGRSAGGGRTDAELDELRGLCTAPLTWCLFGGPSGEGEARRFAGRVAAGAGA